MASFNWDTYFETGLKTVDEQHQKLVEIINEFGDLLTQIDGIPFDDIQKVFGELINYTNYHFKEEENMMSDVGLFPNYIKIHKKLHADFLQELERAHDEILANNDSAENLLKLLIHWLSFHILGTDQSMAKQVAAVQSGTNPEEAYLTEKYVKENTAEPLLVALNGLFQQVSERNRELLEFNRTLEKKVEERTKLLSEANQLLEKLAMTDVLTGLPNRRHAMTQLFQVWNSSIQNDSPMACMMIDADGFKQINDNYGHDAGDEVLRQLSKELRNAVRTDDIVCRLGGDEFLVICPLTNLEGAMLLAEKMRKQVADLLVSVDGGKWLGSISVGVSVRTGDMKNPEDLIKAADEGVYIAKHNGRNCVGCILG